MNIFGLEILLKVYDPACGTSGMLSIVRGKTYSRIAVVYNVSPLFTGDFGSGEIEIRRWMFENDWLESIIALPEQLFFNTGIATYIWILTNKNRYLPK